MRNYEKKDFNKPGRYPFKVPDGYFDNLTARIMERIPEEQAEDKTDNVVTMTPKHKANKAWMTALAVAASVALLVVVSLKIFNTPPVANYEDTMAFVDEEVTDEEMLFTMVDNNDIYNYLAGYEY